MAAPPITTPPAPPATPGAKDEPRREGIAFEAEHGLVGSRHIVFATRNLPPPAELYITSDDGLYITVTNIQAGLTVNIVAQILLPDGRLSSNLYTVQPPSTATPTTYFFLLTEGYLFNVTVQSVPNLRRGACWITVAIRRGNITSGVTLQTLIQDYVDAFSGPTWPGGSIRASTEGTGLLVSQYFGTIAAGVQWNFTVPANLRIRMRAFNAILTTSATVATRTAGLQIYDSAGNIIYMDDIEMGQPASTPNRYVWAFGLGWSQTTASASSLTRGAPDMYLGPGFILYTACVNFQATDQWSAVNIAYEQWFSV